MRRRDVLGTMGGLRGRHGGRGEGIRHIQNMAVPGVEADVVRKELSNLGAIVI